MEVSGGSCLRRATGSPASQIQTHTRLRLFQDEHISDKREVGEKNQSGTGIQWQEAKARGERGFILIGIDVS